MVVAFVRIPVDVIMLTNVYTVAKNQRKITAKFKYINGTNNAFSLPGIIKEGWCGRFVNRRVKTSRKDHIPLQEEVNYLSEILKMLLQWLMLFMPLVHNSLAFPGMYEDIDGKCF